MLLVCLSHSTIATVDMLGENHDGVVYQWRNALLGDKVHESAFFCHLINL